MIWSLYSLLPVYNFQNKLYNSVIGLPINPCKCDFGLGFSFDRPEIEDIFVTIEKALFNGLHNASISCVKFSWTTLHMFFADGDNTTFHGEGDGGGYLSKCGSIATGTAHDISALSARLPRSFSRGTHGDFSLVRLAFHVVPRSVADAASLLLGPFIPRHVRAHPRRGMLPHQTLLSRHVGESTCR